VYAGVSGGGGRISSSLLAVQCERANFACGGGKPEAETRTDLQHRGQGLFLRTENAEVGASARRCSRQHMMMISCTCYIHSSDTAAYARLMLGESTSFFSAHTRRLL
jgi:hypothetical protein